MTLVAWDIETCPRPEEALSESHRRRHRKETEHQMKKSGQPEAEPSDEVRSKAASLHPMLGWICCISAAAGSLEDGPREPTSWTASSPEEEEEMLRAFWEDIEAMTNRTRRVRWVTFNGKQFDAPFVSARSVKRGVRPTNRDILGTHKYRSDSHLDLSNVWQSPWYGLEDLCDHLGVESPKDGFDGSHVAPAIRDGDTEKVRRYCERDAVATFRCAQEIVPLL